MAPNPFGDKLALGCEDGTVRLFEVCILMLRGTSQRAPQLTGEDSEVGYCGHLDGGQSKSITPALSVL